MGIVRDPTGAAIEGATVETWGGTIRTDARGAFRLSTANVDTLTISVHRLGFDSVSALLTARSGKWDTVKVEMARSSQRLSSVTVKETPTRRALGLRDFEERRLRGNGLFITRQEIAARNTSRLSDILRNKRGVNLVRLRNGTYGARFIAHTGKGTANCSPDIWLDGQRARGMEIDDLLADDIEAMELYESFSTTPFEFTPQSANEVPCGSIVIWTRVPAGKAP
jgi:hypothetical protein